MKTIGIIGGLAWESSAVYYRVLNVELRKRLGPWHSARIILDSLDFHPFATAQSRDDFELLRQTLIASAERLETAGAEVLLMACNTVHRFADALQDSTAIPLLHIADPAGHALVQDGHRKVGLLGTQRTLRYRGPRSRTSRAGQSTQAHRERTQRRTKSGGICRRN
jgi:aspartate racemase